MNNVQRLLEQTIINSKLQLGNLKIKNKIQIFFILFINFI